MEVMCMQTRKEFCKNCLVLALVGAGVPMIFSSQQKDGKSAAQSGRKDKMIAYCGITCSNCEAYIATQKNDDVLRAQAAKAWSEKFKREVKASDINCDGCPSDSQRIVQYCKICDIRKCAREKKLSSCAACSTYPCEKLSKFLAGAPEAKKTLEAIRQGKS
jgi:hypothetical protein